MNKLQFFFILFFYGITLNSQSFKPINTINGFTAKTIYDVEFDKNGVLWIATYSNGVYRYDGINLERIIDTSNVGTYHIRKIFFDNGIELIGGNKNLYKIHDTKIQKGDVFKEIQQITDIKKIGNSEFLISTAIGLYRYKNNILSKINFHIDGTIICPSIIIDHKTHTQLFCTFLGLYPIDNDYAKVTKLQLPNYESFKALNGNIVNDSLCLATSEGLFVIKNNLLLKVYNDSVFDFENDTLLTSSSQISFLMKSVTTEIKEIKISSSPLNVNPNEANYN